VRYSLNRKSSEADFIQARAVRVVELLSNKAENFPQQKLDERVINAKPE